MPTTIDPSTGWMTFLLLLGIFTLCVAEAIRLFGWEWIICRAERVYRKILNKRPEDDDDDPRGGMGGFPS